MHVNPLLEFKTLIEFLFSLWFNRNNNVNVCF